MSERRCPACGAPPYAMHDEDCPVIVLRHRETLRDPHAWPPVDAPWEMRQVPPSEYLTFAYESGLR